MIPTDFTDLHRLAGRHVGAVALRADADMGAAGQNGTDLHILIRLAVLQRLHDDAAARFGVIIWFAFTITSPYPDLMIVSQE